MGEKTKMSFDQPVVPPFQNLAAPQAGASSNSKLPYSQYGQHFVGQTQSSQAAPLNPYLFPSQPIYNQTSQNVFPYQSNNAPHPQSHYSQQYPFNSANIFDPQRQHVQQPANYYKLQTAFSPTTPTPNPYYNMPDSRALTQQSIHASSGNSQSGVTPK
jgi:hypothetical protein